MMQIGIVGNGYVGKATALLRSDDIKVFIYDKDPEKCSPLSLRLKEIACCSFIFICVPTPRNDDGSCDVDAVESVIGELESYGAPLENIVVRSTVPVGTCRRLGVSHMPEFLTEKNWEEDFKNVQYRLVGTNSTSYSLQEKINKLLHLGEGKMACFCTTEESELVKYVRNTFLATKVSFFNEIEEYCSKMDIDYEMVSACVAMDERIGESHTKVPGPDGKRGFGGSCFGKDTESFLNQLVNSGVESYIIEAAIARNKQVDRPEM